jgi:hypothetical protein
VEGWPGGRDMPDSLPNLKQGDGLSLLYAIAKV